MMVHTLDVRRLGNARYLAVSMALHAIIFSAVIFIVVQKEIAPPQPLAMSVSVMVFDAAQKCPVLSQQKPESIERKPSPQPSKPAEPVATSTIEPVKNGEPPQMVQANVLAPVTHSTAPESHSVTDLVQQVESSKNSTASSVKEGPIEATLSNATYLNNPKPYYPKISKRLGEEGTVILKVHVLADGTAGSVSIMKASGFDRLDQSALDAVKKWKFVAAKQGNEAVDSWVSIPVSFKLEG